MFLKRMANECRDGFFGINNVCDYKAAKKRLFPPSENSFSFDTIVDNAYKQQSQNCIRGENEIKYLPYYIVLTRYSFLSFVIFLAFTKQK